jgi:hypothetical protein
VASVDLSLSRSGSAGPYEPLATGLANTGAYEWSVSGPPSSNAFLKVTVYDSVGNVAQDTSDAAFTIAYPAPVAHMVGPNGGETLVVGQVDTLRWSASGAAGVASVDLSLSRSGSAGPYEPLATGLANTGAYEWSVSGPPSTNAFLQVVAHDSVGNAAADTSDAAFVIESLPVGVGDAPISDFDLEPARPNPMTGVGHFSFTVPRRAWIRLSVLDVQGRVMAVLVDGEREAGRHGVEWDGRTDRGRARAGLYFVRLQTPTRNFVRRIVLAR